MALQYSVQVRNAKLDAVQTSIGTSPILRVFSNTTLPANCAAANTGSLIAAVTLPSSWMAAASAGSKVLSGTWTGNAVSTNTAAHFRIYESTGTNCHVQGTITIAGGGGDMVVDNTSFATNQTFTVTTFTLNAGNA